MFEVLQFPTKFIVFQRESIRNSRETSLEERMEKSKVGGNVWLLMMIEQTFVVLIQKSRGRMKLCQFCDDELQTMHIESMLAVDFLLIRKIFNHQKLRTRTFVHRCDETVMCNAYDNNFVFIATITNIVTHEKSKFVCRGIQTLHKLLYCYHPSIRIIPQFSAKCHDKKSIPV